MTRLCLDHIQVIYDVNGPTGPIQTTTPDECSLCEQNPATDQPQTREDGSP
jgi:hypothetical protein